MIQLDDSKALKLVVAVQRALSFSTQAMEASRRAGELLSSIVDGGDIERTKEPPRNFRVYGGDDEQHEVIRANADVVDLRSLPGMPTVAEPSEAATSDREVAAIEEHVEKLNAHFPEISKGGDDA